MAVVGTALKRSGGQQFGSHQQYFVDLLGYDDL